MITEFLDSGCPLVEKGVLLRTAWLPEKLLSLAAWIAAEDPSAMVWAGQIPVVRIRL